MTDPVDEWWRGNLAEIAESLTDEGWHRALSCAMATRETLLRRKGDRFPLRATFEQCYLLLRSLDGGRLDALLRDHYHEPVQIEAARADILGLREGRIETTALFERFLGGDT